MSSTTLHSAGSRLEPSAWATAPGKVNLYFAVGSPRHDGYHPVASLYAATSLVERVEVRGGGTGVELSMSLTPGSPVHTLHERGQFDPAEVPLDERNLAHRAACAVLGAQGIPVDRANLRVHIDKAVPVAGGMGGGSADAAAALKAVNEYLVLASLVAEPLSAQTLHELGAALGADVPFALLGGIAVGEGVGEKLTPLEVSPARPLLHGVVVASRKGLSTPRVFAELDAGRAAGRYAPAGSLTVPKALVDVLTGAAGYRDEEAYARAVAAHIRNDLAAPALALQPGLARTVGRDDLAVVTGFVSGSGPSIILLACSYHHAAALEQRLTQEGAECTIITV